MVVMSSLLIGIFTIHFYGQDGVGDYLPIIVKVC